MPPPTLRARSFEIARLLNVRGPEESPIWSYEVKPKCACGVVPIIAMVLLCLDASAGATQSSPTKVHNSSKVAPLVAPKTTPVEDARYLTDVAKADSDLATYIQQQGNLALRTVLTDGSAFCAFLRRGGGIRHCSLERGFRGQECGIEDPSASWYRYLQRH